MKKMMRCLFLLFIGLIGLVDSCQVSQDVDSVPSSAQLYPFVKFKSVSLLEFQEKVDVSRSYRTADPIQCARLIANDCSSCKPLGFLYDAASRACQPIPWEDGAEVILQDLRPGNSSLYNFRTKHCRDGFETFYEKIGNYTITSCFYTIDKKQRTYPEAVTYCSNKWGFIASAKTQERLALLIKLSLARGRQVFWVGLDQYQDPLTFRWVEDGTKLSQRQTEEMFQGMSSKLGNDCVAFVPPGNSLFNGRCDVRRYSFCEIKPGC